METPFTKYSPDLNVYKKISEYSVLMLLCFFFIFPFNLPSIEKEAQAVYHPILMVPNPPVQLVLAEIIVEPEVETEPAMENKEMKSAVETPSTRPSGHITPFHDIISKAAGRYQVDPALIQAIIMAESGYNPKARSKRGARGLMQLMPVTAKSLGVLDAYDPEDNINGGVRYFKELLDRFDGDVSLALAAYNAGSRYVRKYNGVPPFRATRIYIKKVLHYHQKYRIKSPSDDTIA